MSVILKRCWAVYLGIEGSDLVLNVVYIPILFSDMTVGIILGSYIQGSHTRRIVDFHRHRQRSM